MSNPSSSTPPWLREDLEDAQPLKQPVGNKAEAGQQVVDERKSKVVYWMLKFVTMFLCVLIAVTAVIGISKLNLSYFLPLSFAIDNMLELNVFYRVYQWSRNIRENICG